MPSPLPSGIRLKTIIAFYAFVALIVVAAVLIGPRILGASG